MRGDVIFQIYGVHGGRAKPSYFGAFRTHDETRAEVGKLERREMHGSTWATRAHDRGFVAREKVVATDFLVPSHPARDWPPPTNCLF